MNALLQNPLLGSSLVPEQLSSVHYIPILTTVISLTFSVILFRRYLLRGGTHHLWWSGGILAYGLGTGQEGSITLLGNSVGLTKAWYIAGALLGGYPLAQGSVYFHFNRNTANRLTVLTLPLLGLLSLLVVLSPVQGGAMESFRPSGDLLQWQWIRWFTPIINLYAVVFLIGTAAWSAWHFARRAGEASRAIGNALIATGALLPGIRGAMAKAGAVEVLYVGEFFGIILIWIGYVFCVKTPSPARNGSTPQEGAGDMAATES